MAKHNELGIRGEQIAADMLIKKRYTILEHNWRHGHLELDIIARNRSEIVFVEVKTRSDNNLMNPEDAVDFNRKCRLTAAANYYVLSKRIFNLEPRFDIIAIILNDRECRVEHFENAFPPTVRTTRTGKKYR